ncbi:GPW/gp25 family protein [Marinibactrum halimedae]|uniref:Baseplate assembly protein n=1 Tax=Marinibactrum halimedae TaxID=1444977 RepID=A0AA37WNA3_9GAMM|nr:GPW/gp25 family protein [Marinibactrum halimedae]MCD9460776.1 GPW/gp25 family protein [Marinibactrum halimedae]GLS27363.1 baseplate assembly protein [Marinibactrum halimedae]
MSGMNAKSGKAITDIEHLKQSIRDILLTPIGSRIMRRSYGSRLMYLIDQPVNALLIATMQGAIIEALTNFEPRLKISRVQVRSLKPGVISLDIDGFFVPDNRIIKLENLTIQR